MDTHNNARGQVRAPYNVRRTRYGTAHCLWAHVIDKVDRPESPAVRVLSRVFDVRIGHQ